MSLLDIKDRSILLQYSICLSDNGRELLGRTEGKEEHVYTSAH